MKITNYSAKNQIACHYPDELLACLFSKVYGWPLAHADLAGNLDKLHKTTVLEGFSSAKPPLIIVYLFITYIIAALHNELFFVNNNGKKI
jgi:hypothetical protein